MIKKPLILRKLGLCHYAPIAQAMQTFTANRKPQNPDELWLLEHYPVFTQGQAGKAEHILDPGSIPVIQSDRGGQATYHGPGQLIVYCLFNLPNLNIGIRGLVHSLENSVLALLAQHKIIAHRQEKAPGIYVENKKIGSLGLRVRRGFTYHGLALNVDMDLTPFQRINPCGYPDLSVTQMKNFSNTLKIETIADALITQLCDEFGFQAECEGFV